MLLRRIIDHRSDSLGRRLRSIWFTLGLVGIPLERLLMLRIPFFLSFIGLWATTACAESETPRADAARIEGIAGAASTGRCGQVCGGFLLWAKAR